MTLDDFRHMWDGSEPGWKLRRIERQEWQLTFMFAESGPTLQEISRLRNLLDDFRNIPLAQVLKQLRGLSSYTLPTVLSNLEMRYLVEKAEQLEFRTSVIELDRSGYLAIHEDCTAMIIEDDEVAREVANRMIQAGIAVETIHYD
jgi:hypothetical protein